MEKGLTCFWSRSRKELWLKGETSGNYQHVVSITADCDKDALVVMVEPDGPACHTGTFSCFNDKVYESDELHEFSYEGLMELIKGRKTEKKEGSYTTYLFEKGLDKILKKVGEESTEVIIAAKADRHILVSKEQGDTTTVEIKILDENEKINALASLASGVVSDSAIEFAKSSSLMLHA